MTSIIRKTAAMLLCIVLTTTAPAQVTTVPDAEPMASQRSELFTLSLGDIPSSENMLQSYVQQRFDELLPGFSHPARHRSAEEALTGDNVFAYDYLKEVIRNVAAGNVETTVFEIPFSAIMEKTEWTAQELGVGSTFPGGSPSQELVKSTFQSCLDLSLVVKALMADLPYECYWFDKTKGWSYSYGWSYNKTKFIFTTITITMNIEQEYAVHDGNSYYPTKFNTSTVAAVNVAVGNAQNIANSSTGSLLDRLQDYKDRICELTSYNTTAVNNDWPYGNPWQLVWVFDGDPSTQVVCEGYAKAFKYLCDLSHFENAECLLVSGMMTGISGSGAHMWNVMKMDDGRSYLVDVTNCEEGTSGYPNYLFLASGPDGSYATSYTFSVRWGNIKYAYSDDTKALYSPNDLTISPTAYDPNAAGITDLPSSGSHGQATAATAYYTLDGKRVYHPQQGIYIVRVRTGNNTLCKLVVK